MAVELKKSWKTNDFKRDLRDSPSACAGPSGRGSALKSGREGRGSSGHFGTQTVARTGAEGWDDGLRSNTCHDN